ncbi:cell division protein ZapE [Denitratisoma sp. DHT3]|uniref:cell division protein ZapE n=1 Tax=Denitratisoma sp. DHT3 TaxID=1981880 RepID=UPI0011983363|nr:cell division protein ZapE [Denitratisoma sp. DHT3]QDX80459.1 cell division protein ZapE [Denitratisoma sp. DHT3]
MLKVFNRICAERGIVPDPAQQAAAERLNDLHRRLLAFKQARSNRFKKLISRAAPPRGLYFWGGVGRGKSFLMDAFYEAVPYRRKRRVHFHAFMHEVHEALRRHRKESDPLMRVAADIARQVRLLCFDEFHVSDIADAMMLGRLFSSLLENGVVVVTTSNYPPDGLYPNGLQRHLFLPTIELLKQHLDVLEVDGGIDYRLRTLERIETFLVPADADAETKMAADFREIAGGEGQRSAIDILGRSVPVRRRADGVIWFDFNTLCGGARSQNDYLELAREHHTLLLSNVPRLSSEQASEARRFTWLVDVLYDHRVKFIVSAAVEADQLYTEGTQAEEFKRTVSRLVEMRSREYLAEAHRVA